MLLIWPVYTTRKKMFQINKDAKESMKFYLQQKLIVVIIKKNNFIILIYYKLAGIFFYLTASPLFINSKERIKDKKSVEISK